MGLSDIVNYIPIDELMATAGQPTEAQFREAREAGYVVVINLAPDGLETSLPGEERLLKSLAWNITTFLWPGPPPGSKSLSASKS